MFTRIADKYQDSTAVVIGAGGIGGAIIQLLAGSVGKLVVADRDEVLLKACAASLEPRKVMVRKLDVRDATQVSGFFAEIQADVGPPDFLFYTAGVLNIEPFSEMTNEAWERAVDVNLNGAFFCSKAAAELMRVQRRGSILILGSISGTKARSGSRVNPVYNTTKAGITAFVNAAAIQLRRDGIRINCISPGPTQTSMMDLQPAQVHASVNEIMLDERMNSAMEVAELALFVAAQGRFTGEDLGMGGGAGLGG